MNTFDENENGFQPEIPQSPADQEPQSAPPVSNQQSNAANHPGEKQSPYANSPYMGYTTPQNNGQYYQHPPKPKKSHRSFWRSFVACVLTVAVVAGGCSITAFMVNSRWERRNQDTIDSMNQQIAELEEKIGKTSASSGAVISGNPVSADGLLTPGQVYTQNVDSVVAISTKVRTTSYGKISEGTASGSGFILTENGYVATNYHVIQDGTEITVITYSGDSYPATIVGYDSTIDLAVLKIEAEGLPAVTLGSSTDLAIGDMVVAIGNPLGELTATQTVGYVSGKNREVTTDNTVISMIQTDAAINPGNSGGPLFNMRGEVVGITTAKYSGTTTGGASIEGIGFAIPMDDIANIINDLKDLGYVTGAYLGVTVTNIDSEAASYYNLPTGARVNTTVEGVSADRAGVKQGDIIIALGEYSVTNVTDLTRALRHFKAGDETTITVLRSGQSMELPITLDEKPQDLNTQQEQAEEQPVPNQEPNDELFDYFRKFFGYGGMG